MSDLFHDEGPPASGRKVMLATTSYDSPAAAYVFSIARSREALCASGIQSSYLLLVGNCHVDDARNVVVREFLESDCTELVFLDADVCWEPKDLVQLCQRDRDIVGGVYPYRRDGGDGMPVRMMDSRKIDAEGLLEVEGLPTGFMKIKRHVLEKIADASPKYFDKVYLTALVFDRPDPDAEGTRWGGDIAFCRKWQAMGGTMYADAELVLGHDGRKMMRDSLAAHIRRLSGTAFAHVIPRIRAGIETEHDYNEIFKACGNPYAADPGVLAVLVGVARKCRGPIIETGSGLSSVLLGAASDSQVYSLEHRQSYAAATVEMCEEAGVANVGVCYAPMKDEWYDIDAFELPAKFTLGFCDGPPRVYGTRMRFFERIAPRCSAIVVDDVKSDVTHLKQVQEWADANGRTLTLMGRAALILKTDFPALKAAA